MSENQASKVAVITGGGRGIGRGVALELARLGYAIVVNYRGDANSAEATRREAVERGSPRAIALQADVADLAQGKRLLDESLNAMGRIDLLVNNAGVAPLERTDLLDMSPESWDRVLGTNLRGPFFLTQAVAREMAKPRQIQGVDPRRIVFITSVSSTFATVTRGEYCVSKAALSMVVKLFAARLADQGIHVFEVRPGIIATDMTGSVRGVYDQRIADGLSVIRRWGTPEDVGKAVAAIASGALPFSTGEVIHVDGGLHLERL